jgi:sugar (pentulose or hexulose) kinase
LPIVLGAADSQCAAYGSGVVAPGPISEMAGASSCLNSVVQEPLSDLRVTHYSHVVPGCYSTELGLNTSGAAVTWAISELGFADYATFEAAATRVRRRATATDPLDLAPVFLPHLGDGERDDPRLRAAFVGLSDRHGRDELAYAVAEGVAFGIAETLDVLVAAGSPLDELRVAGGGARIALLGQLKADALGVPVRHMTVDTAPVGAALLAASALGHASQVAAAVEGLLDAAQGFTPDAACGEVLAERRSWYRAVQAATSVRLPEREEPS